MAGLESTPGNGMPQRLIIPSLKIDAPISAVGLTASGDMAVPSSGVGWYEFGPRPGEPGNAVIDGHLDTPYGPAIFWDLHKLQPGDTIEVLDDRGVNQQFRVTDVQAYSATTPPLDLVFGASDSAHLNLVTCDGVWLRAQHIYSQRLVVFAEQITRREPPWLSKIE